MVVAGGGVSVGATPTVTESMAQDTERRPRDEVWLPVLVP
jgi:hypothetical protein